MTCESTCKVYESPNLGLGQVCVVFQLANGSLFFYQSVCAIREVSFQYNAFEIRDCVVRFVEVSVYW